MVPTMSAEASDARRAIEQEMQRHGITIESVFVPWSKSRNAGEKSPSLNWRVTVKKGERAILTTDYSAGMGHAPSYRSHSGGMPVDVAEAVRWECEHGRRGRGMHRSNPVGGEILPDPCDVIYSLASDADALDYATFEEWARALGYDEDSRKGETIYRACLEIGLKLRAALGESGLAALRTATEGF